MTPAVHVLVVAVLCALPVVVSALAIVEAVRTVRSRGEE